MKQWKFFLLILFLTTIGIYAVGQKTESGSKKHPGWSRNATIYEVNLRQYTPRGTFRAFESELPRLQKMGVDILWLMPINPLGEKNRKGSLGSYYSVRDYYAVNPEYGTLAEFKQLVRRIHDLKMKVIIDWVANHTSWDNPLITNHPEWYKKDGKGNIVPPVSDWTDVAGLDYTNPALRKYMTDVLCYWVRETDIDGYRCDVAGMLPVDFWNKAIPEAEKIKPLFMLAEEESPQMHDIAFDATYSWNFFHLMNEIAQGKKTANQIDSLYIIEKKSYPSDAFRMRFTSNHDENSWNGTEYERLGRGAEAFAVLCFTFPGIPLVYSGQESAMKKRLRFFDKDTIPWVDYPLAPLYSRLMSLKKNNSLLYSGTRGGEFIKINNSANQSVYSFIRTRGNQKLLVILNLSDMKQSVLLKGNDYQGRYIELFTGSRRDWKPDDRTDLNPWQYLVFETK